MDVASQSRGRIVATFNTACLRDLPCLLAGKADTVITTI